LRFLVGDNLSEDEGMAPNIK